MKSKAIFEVMLYAIICLQVSAELNAVVDKGLFVQGITTNMPSFRNASQQGVGADLSKITRAPRPDALSFPGSTPQIVGSSDSALLAEIQKCVCEINNEIRRNNSSSLDSCCSEVAVVDSKIDLIVSLIDNEENCCSEIGIIDSKLNVIQTTLDNIELQLETLSASSLDSIVSTFTLLVVLSNELLSTVEIIVSLSDIISDNFSSINEVLQTVIDVVVNIDSKVDVLDSKIDVITSLIENEERCCSEIDVINSKANIIESIVSNITTENCCSEIDVIGSKINIVTSIVSNITFSIPDTCCSEVELILSNVGSRSDFAFSFTDQISTIDQIDQLQITVIAWLKTLLADLHGL